MYIKLGKDKRPKHSLDVTFTQEEVLSELSYGMMVPEPYVVIDIDDQDEFDRVYRIVKDRGIKTRVLKTTKGGHFWFRSLKPLKNHVDIRTPLTVDIDVRSYGKKSYVALKLDGIPREWIQYDEEVDELPYWLKPYKTNKKFVGMKEGDGRNSAIFAYIIPLMNNRFSKSQIQETFTLISEYIFEDPLETAEIEAMMDNDIFEDNRAIFFDGKKFLHHEFATWLKSTHFIKWHAGSLWVYKDGVYIDDEIYLGRLMIDQIPELTSRQRRETADYLRLLGSPSIKDLPSTMLNVPNGILDITTGKIQQHTPFLFTTNRIPTVYNPLAYDETVDRTLDKLVCGDKDLRMLIEEMIGYTLYGENTFQKAFILVGGGSNGKSSLIDMITNMLGIENISTLTLDEFEHRFKPPELVGKVANLGDDIPKELIRESSVFKRAVTGDAITAERKGQDAFTFRNKAKLIFSANELPPTTDKSHGFMRRMVIIPFNATFSPTDPDYDRNIGEKLTTPQAASYLLNLGIKGLKRLLKRGKFKSVSSVSDLISEYEASNNSAVEWLNEGGEVENRAAKEVYVDYSMFCASYGMKAYSATRFNREIKAKLDVDTVRTTTNGKTQQVWRTLEYIEKENN